MSRPFTKARQRLATTTVIVIAIAAAGCRNTTSRRPPLHWNQNMDFQHRFEAQEENAFFADRRAMRPQVAGTIARGGLHEDDHLYRGRIAGGAWADALPIPVDKALLQRGQSRFEIYCAPCHDKAGTGQGLVARRGVKQGMIAPPDFQSARVRTMPVGQMFNSISNGFGSMPAYARQIPVHDRWAVVAYVRVLEASRSAPLSLVPADIAEQRGWSGSASAGPPAATTPDKKVGTP